MPVDSKEGWNFEAWMLKGKDLGCLVKCHPNAELPAERFTSQLFYQLLVSRGELEARVALYSPMPILHMGLCHYSQEGHASIRGHYTQAGCNLRSQENHTKRVVHKVSGTGYSLRESVS